jgi:hypothetical protein
MLDELTSALLDTEVVLGLAGGSEMVAWCRERGLSGDAVADGKQEPSACTSLAERITRHGSSTHARSRPHSRFSWNTRSARSGRSRSTG